MATGRVVLTADTTALQTGLTRAQGYVKGFAASASSSLMGLFAAGAVIGQFNSLRNELDRIGKLAERGFSTDFLQDLAGTADLAGASLEQAVKGFSKLVGEINRAGQPTQELRDGLSKIGLTVDELRGMAPERVFEIVAERIGSMTDESEQLAAVTGVLGTRYMDLVPLLNQYAQSGLENVAKASAEQIARTEEFNDSLTRLGQTLKGVFIPVLDLVGKAFSAVNHSMQAMGAGIGGLVNFFGKLKDGMGPTQALREAFAETRIEIEKIAQGLYGTPSGGKPRQAGETQNARVMRRNSEVDAEIDAFAKDRRAQVTVTADTAELERVEREIEAFTEARWATVGIDADSGSINQAAAEIEAFAKKHRASVDGRLQAEMEIEEFAKRARAELVKHNYADADQIVASQKGDRETAMLTAQKKAADETERRLKAEKEIAETRSKMAQDLEESGKSDLEIAEMRLARAASMRDGATGSGADRAEADAAATAIEASAQALLLRERERLAGADFSPARANVSEIQRIGGGGGVGVVGMERVVKVGEEQLVALGRIEGLLAAIRAEGGGF